jgi:predicted MFS family arabinose efflux permease
MGFGLCMGPTLSAGLYTFLNYSGTFFFFACFILLIGYLGISVVPNTINDNPGEEDETEYVTMGAFFKRKFVVLCLVTVFFSCIFFFFFDPTLSV